MENGKDDRSSENGITESSESLPGSSTGSSRNKSRSRASSSSSRASSKASSSQCPHVTSSSRLSPSLDPGFKKTKSSSSEKPSSSKASKSQRSSSPPLTTSCDANSTNNAKVTPSSSEPLDCAGAEMATKVGKEISSSFPVTKLDVLKKQRNNAYRVMKQLEQQLDEAKLVYTKINGELVKYKEQLGFEKNKAKIEEMKSNIESEWIDRNFDWTKQIHDVLKNTFKLNEFRPKQLAAINVTMSKKDMLLVMPTGGGKSLVYQLPAVIEKQFTMVISPLISLIEDQVMALKKLGIPAVAVHSGIGREQTRSINEQMSKIKKTKFKLLYVTPEWIAKNKSFMGHLQKAYNAGVLARVAIDEVHCCSSWGHDFRPDYKFLGIVRQQLPNVPFVGLTATATTKVLTDVQQMLNMENCEIITAPFNRPNLFYKVVRKPPKEQLVDYFVKLVDETYMHQSGIIYTNTINEAVSLAKELRQRGLSVAPYHAQMDHEVKVDIHNRWMAGSCQVIIATIAFGMGIDKPDVRFVIHAAPPKSMESLYQESGRAGRDGRHADCLVLFSLKDYFKNLGMTNSLIEEKKLNDVLEYCLEQKKCRRLMFSQHFEESWNQSECLYMCDHCKVDSSNSKWYDLTKAGMNIQDILNQATINDEKMTLSKLLDAWYQTGPAKNRVASLPLPKIGRDLAEIVIAFLLFKEYLGITKGYSSYSTIIYLEAANPIAEDDKIEMYSHLKFIGFPRRYPRDDAFDDIEPPVKRTKTAE